MKIKIGDVVVLGKEHIMEGTVVKILRLLPAPSGKMWEAVVVNGKTKTWVTPEQIERKL